MSFTDTHSFHANTLLKSTLALKQIIDTFEYCEHDGYDRNGPETTEWYLFVIYKEEEAYVYQEYHAYEDYKAKTKYILCSEFKSPVLMILPKPSEDDEDPSSSFFEHTRRQHLVMHLEDTCGVIDDEMLENISSYILDNTTIVF